MNDYTLKLTAGQLKALGVMILMARHMRDVIADKMNNAPATLTRRDFQLMQYAAQITEPGAFADADRIVADMAAEAVEAEDPRVKEIIDAMGLRRRN